MIKDKAAFIPPVSPESSAGSSSRRALASATDRTVYKPNSISMVTAPNIPSSPVSENAHSRMIAAKRYSDFFIYSLPAAAGEISADRPSIRAVLAVTDPTALPAAISG